MHPIYEAFHASGLGTCDGPHQWAGLSTRLRRRLWTRGHESGFSPAGGRVVFITGLPTDACDFYGWVVCLRLPFGAQTKAISVTNLVMFYARCDGLGTYTRFRGHTRVPPVTNLVLLMHLAVILLPAGCLPPHGGCPRGRPARGSGRGLGAPETPCASR